MAIGLNNFIKHNGRFVKSDYQLTEKIMARENQAFSCRHYLLRPHTRKVIVQLNAFSSAVSPLGVWPCGTRQFAITQSVLTGKGYKIQSLKFYQPTLMIKVYGICAGRECLNYVKKVKVSRGMWESLRVTFHQL